MKRSYRFYFLLSVFSSAHVVLLHRGKSPAPRCHLLSLNFCCVWEAVASCNHSVTAGIVAVVKLFLFFFFFLSNQETPFPSDATWARNDYFIKIRRGGFCVLTWVSNGVERRMKKCENRPPQASNITFWEVRPRPFKGIWKSFCHTYGFLKKNGYLGDAVGDLTSCQRKGRRKPDTW